MACARPTVPVRHAVDRVLGIAAATPAPTLAPTTEPAAVGGDPATAMPTASPTPTPAGDVAAPPVDDAHRDDESPSDREVAGSPTAPPALTPVPTAGASPTWAATSAAADPAIGSGGAPAAATSVPTAPAPNPTPGVQVPPDGPTPPVRPTPDRDGRGGRRRRDPEHSVDGVADRGQRGVADAGGRGDAHREEEGCR